jgi:hypothetical protein
MSPRISLLLSVIAGVVAAGCNFRFDNPLEQCPSTGCAAMSGDAGVGNDAGIDGGAAEVTVDSPWATEVIFRDDQDPTPFYEGTIGFASDEPFVGFEAFKGGLPQAHFSQRSGGRWNTSDIGLTSSLGFGIDAVEGGSAPSLIIQQPEYLFFSEWNGALSVLDSYRLMELDPSLYSAVVVAPTRDATGALYFARKIENGIEFLSWNGDHNEINLTSELIPGTQDASPIAIAIGPGGALHLFFLTKNGDLSYGRRDANGWQTQVVRNELAFAYLPQLLAVSSQDEPIYCYSQEGTLQGSSSLLCRRLANGAWETQFVVANTRSTSFSVDGLKIDSSDHIHLAYLEDTNLEGSRHRARLHHAEWNGAEWIDTVVAQGELAQYEAISGVALGLDSSDRPHITFGISNMYIHATPRSGE